MQTPWNSNWLFCAVYPGEWQETMPGLNLIHFNPFGANPTYYITLYPNMEATILSSKFRTHHQNFIRGTNPGLGWEHSFGRDPSARWSYRAAWLIFSARALRSNIQKLPCKKIDQKNETVLKNFEKYSELVL